MTSSSSKTPVSTLHELFVVQGITPYYNLIVNGIGSHNPVFKYRLECGDLVSFGTGKSKKEAKHDAAKNALNLLKNDEQSAKGSEELLQKMEVEEANNPVESPYQDVLKQNVVGALAALCSSNRINEPVYELIGEEGPPHCKTFTIQCTVLHLKEVAQARTKKQAKHKSSKQILDKLLVHFNNCLDFAAIEEELDGPNSPKRRKQANTQNEPAENSLDQEENEVKDKYVTMQKNKPLVENYGVNISEYHIANASKDINTYLHHPNFESLKSMDIKEIQEMDDPYLYIVSIFEGLDFELEWNDFPALERGVYLKSVLVHTSPPWFFIGEGESKEKAHRSCCTQMLKFFKCLLK
ncbi:hypothetical protein LSTR_LSTR012978 [Laodelphax striatellus]|uniref:DRBM domain-containing protein n=1 Tax=Laodelphax striatellus TaxID=195883 RepID=A0A482XLE8_LAOST|nr:hypothetical protein LSTR_LSTR012978 [Laodelphax striatellus]WOZ50362.1 R2D2 [Laodelphax striatellus]